jgi:hypothetical protein
MACIEALFHFFKGCVERLLLAAWAGCCCGENSLEALTACAPWSTAKLQRGANPIADIADVHVVADDTM